MECRGEENSYHRIVVPFKQVKVQLLIFLLSNYFKEKYKVSGIVTFISMLLLF